VIQDAYARCASGQTNLRHCLGFESGKRLRLGTLLRILWSTLYPGMCCWCCRTYPGRLLHLIYEITYSRVQKNLSRINGNHLNKRSHN
jgi:hypothetical protein